MGKREEHEREKEMKNLVNLVICFKMIELYIVSS